MNNVWKFYEVTHQISLLLAQHKHKLQRIMLSKTRGTHTGNDKQETAEQEAEVKLVQVVKGKQGGLQWIYF